MDRRDMENHAPQPQTHAPRPQTHTPRPQALELESDCGEERPKTVMMPSFSEKVLEKFAREEKTKVFNFLTTRYRLDRDTCEDIFQESFIVLWQKNRDGQLDNMTASLSTYFLGICKRKAFEEQRRRGKAVTTDDDASLTLRPFDLGKCDEILTQFESEQTMLERKERLVRQIVSDLPEPCDKLLWGFFRDNLAMTALAEQCNYTLGSVRVTKHRCQEKFKNRYNDLVNSLF